MNGLFHYFLAVVDPMTNLGFARALGELMSSRDPAWWLLFVLRCSSFAASLARRLDHLSREPGRGTPAAARPADAGRATRFGGDRRAQRIWPRSGR